MTKSQIIVAISGGGRTLTNLIEASRASSAFDVVGVISSSDVCKGNDIARAHELPLFIDTFQHPSAALTTRMYAWVKQQNADLIALAGFLKLFPLHPDFHNRVLNIHPALLPAFGGKGMYGHKVHTAVLQKNMTESGATVHFVNERYDEGRILAQIRVPVHSNDTPDLLAKRVFAAECKLYPAALHDLIVGKLPLPDAQIKQYAW